MSAPLCPICGKPVPPSKTRPRKYCSKKCENKGHYLGAIWREGLARKNETRARLCARDEAYEKVAAPVTVEVRGGIRIETRGQRCIGWRSSGRVSHS